MRRLGGTFVEPTVLTDVTTQNFRLGQPRRITKFGYYGVPGLDTMRGGKEVARAAGILVSVLVAAGSELPVAASSVKSPPAPPRTIGANRRFGIGAIGRARLPAARFIPRMRIAWHLDAQTVNGRMGAAQQCA